MKGMVIIMVEEEKSSKFKHIILPIIIAVFSFFVLSRIIVLIPWNQRYINAIDDSNTKTLGLIAGALGTSELIRAIPGEAGNSTADTLAMLGRMFMIVKGALYLEKTILIVSAPVVFKILVPIACAFHAVGHGLKIEDFKSISVRIIAFAVALLLLIPVSLELSGLIEDACENTINETIESSGKIKKSANQSSNEDGNVLSKVLGSVKNIFGKAVDTVSHGIDNVKNLVSRMIESFIIMLITTCLIPILVIWLFIKIIKRLFNVDVSSDKSKNILGGFIKNESHKDKKVKAEKVEEIKIEEETSEK